jgi:hypothetical protein
MEPSEQAIDAAYAVICQTVDLPFMAHVRDFVYDGMEGTERETALRALRAADQEAEAGNRAFVAEALRAAYSIDLKSVTSSRHSEDAAS